MPRSDESRSAIVRWFHEGPDETDGMLGWFVGNLVWWRFWATAFLIALPIGVGLIALSEWGGFWAVWATAFAHMLTHEKMLEVNPKYELTKNY